MVAWMVDLSIFVMEAIMSKSGHGGSIGGGFGNGYKGKSYVEIDHQR